MLNVVLGMIDAEDEPENVRTLCSNIICGMIGNLNDLLWETWMVNDHDVVLCVLWKPFVPQRRCDRLSILLVAVGVELVATERLKE